MFLIIALLFCFQGSEAFNHVEFLDKYCTVEANIKVTADAVKVSDISGFLCEHFVLKEEDIRGLASTSVIFSKGENVVFKYCDLGYFNEDLTSLFPRIRSLYIENCKVSLKQTTTSSKKTTKSPLKRISFFNSTITDNLKSSAFKKMTHLNDFLVFRSNFEHPIIDSQLLEANRNLDWIYILHSNIKELSKDLLKNIPELSELHLSGNSIQNFDESFFENQTELSFLSLMDNKLRSLPSSLDLLYKQQNLEFINLSGNDISVDQLLRVHFKKFVRTIYLDLSRNTRITSIALDAFKDMDGLRFLNVSGSNIEILDTLGSRNVTQLDISKNKIRTIEEDVFQGLSKLGTLDLSDNLIEVIEEAAFKDLRRLFYLNISGNHLSEINENHFKGLGRLTVLDLSGNSITRLHNESFLHLSSLENLHLQSNLLKIISGDFLFPSSLKTLDVSRNSLQFLGKETFRNLKLLSYLNLSYTNRTYYYFSKQCLKGLANLKELKFQGNMMKLLGSVYIPESLETLDVSSNRLSVLLESDFEKLANLKEVDFGRNLIRTIKEGVMENLRKLSWVDFSDNPIDKVMGRPFNEWKDSYNGV